MIKEQTLVDKIETINKLLLFNIYNIDMDALMDHNRYNYSIEDNVFYTIPLTTKEHKCYDFLYKIMNAYDIMLQSVPTIIDLPIRHRIIQSTDSNSCLRYLNFLSNKVIVHFRSQNSNMKDPDAYFLQKITNYYNTLTTSKIEVIVVNVDQYITIL